MIHLFGSLGLIVMAILACVSFLSGFCFRGKTQAVNQRIPELHEKNALMEGKQKTDLSVNLNYVVEGSPERIFHLWTTVSETKRFFGTDAVIDLRPGGSYEIYFLPRDNPESDINSTKGARLLDMEKGKKLIFEWTMPPFACELNTKPLPTWVEVTFQSLKNHPGKTHVSLKHFGFKKGSLWEKAYEYFVRNWGLVLFRLDLLCANEFSTVRAQK